MLTYLTQFRPSEYHHPQNSLCLRSRNWPYPSLGRPADALFLFQHERDQWRPEVPFVLCCLSTTIIRLSLVLSREGNEATGIRCAQRIQQHRRDAERPPAHLPRFIKTTRRMRCASASYSPPLPRPIRSSWRQVTSATSIRRRKVRNVPRRMRKVLSSTYRLDSEHVDRQCARVRLNAL